MENDVEDDSSEIEEAVLFDIHDGVIPLPGVGGYEEYQKFKKVQK